MHLVVFDIDGTLTLGDAVGEECFCRTIEQLLGADIRGADLSTFRNVTDSGIVAELSQRRSGRQPTSEEVADVEAAYCRALAVALQTSAQGYSQVRGAARMLDRLRQRHDLAVALATGNWAAAARTKLESAELWVDDVPFASASDSWAREDIVRLAVERAEEANEVDGFSSVTCVGDGVWDARVAKSAGHAFIGIASWKPQSVLFAEGAAAVFADFMDLASFEEAIERVDNRRMAADQ